MLRLSGCVLNHQVSIKAASLTIAGPFTVPVFTPAAVGHINAHTDSSKSKHILWNTIWQSLQQLQGA